MYIYIYIHIHVYMYMYIHLCICVYIYICMSYNPNLRGDHQRGEQRGELIIYIYICICHITLTCEVTTSEVSSVESSCIYIYIYIYIYVYIYNPNLRGDHQRGEQRGELVHAEGVGAVQPQDVLLREAELLLGVAVLGRARHQRDALCLDEGCGAKRRGG